MKNNLVILTAVLLLAFAASDATTAHKSKIEIVYQPQPAQSSPSDEYTRYAYYSENDSRPVSKPVVWVTPLNRDVCGGKFADHYGLFIVLGLFAIGIILELVALAILFDDGNSRIGWGIAVGSLLFWLVAGLTPMIGRLPVDWFRTPQGCHDEGEYRQMLQHSDLSRIAI